ncbi:MAG: hypothetical protein HRT35_11875 [Algicola sp.]|nr:hypothetical protein [Algicola sp.]
MNDKHSRQSQLNELLKVADNEALVSLVKTFTKDNAHKSQLSIDYLQQRESQIIEDESN